MLYAKMRDSSRKFLERYLPKFFEFDNLDAALLDLDAFITAEGLDENDEMTAFGHEAQSVYDDLFLNN